MANTNKRHRDEIAYERMERYKNSARMGIYGYASPSEKLMWKHLVLEKGIKEKYLPAEYRDTIVGKTKPDLLGQLEVRRITGLTAKGPYKMITQFEDNLPGGLLEKKADLIEKLEANDNLPQEQLELVQLLKEHPRKGLPHIMALAGVKPTQTLTLYAKGAVILGKVQAAIEAHNNLPRIMKDLISHALDKEGVCDVCVGSGKVKNKPASAQEREVCPQCKGNGKSVFISPHKEFAVKQVLEATGTTGKRGEGTTVNVNQQVAFVGQKGSFMEKVMATSEKVLYGKRDDDIKLLSSSDPVEVEVVE